MVGSPNPHFPPRRMPSSAKYSNAKCHYVSDRERAKEAATGNCCFAELLKDRFKGNHEPAGEQRGPRQYAPKRIVLPGIFANVR